MKVAHAAAMASTTAEKSAAGPHLAGAVTTAALQLSSSQKQSLPRPLLCDMHTWSTMKRLIWSCVVHVRRMLSAAEKIQRKQNERGREGTRGGEGGTQS